MAMLAVWLVPVTPAPRTLPAQAAPAGATSPKDCLRRGGFPSLFAGYDDIGFYFGCRWPGGNEEFNPYNLSSPEEPTAPTEPPPADPPAVPTPPPPPDAPICFGFGCPQPPSSPVSPNAPEPPPEEPDAGEDDDVPPDTTPPPDEPVPPPAPRQPLPVLEANDETLPGILASAQVPVVIDFWAPWCVHCRPMMQIVEELSNERAGRVQVVKVNFDASPNMAEQFHVEVLPSVVFFRDGQMVTAITGGRPRDAVFSTADSIIPPEPTP